MNNENLYGGLCPVVYALNVIGGKWRIPILWKLSQNSLRYNELKRQLNGITNIMLTRSLKELERYGLIRRVQHEEIPPHVEYFLTEQGKKLIPGLIIVNEWGKEQMKKDNISFSDHCEKYKEE